MKKQGFFFLSILTFLLGSGLYWVGCRKAEAPKTKNPAAAVPSAETEDDLEIVITQNPNKKYAEVGTPMRAIQDVDDVLDHFKKGKELSKADQKYNEKLKRKIIYGTFDVRELSRLALANHWDERSAADHDRFINLMVALLEEKALFAHEQSAAKSKEGGKYGVIYQDERFLEGDSNRALVLTKVNVPSENISIQLNYRLKKNEKNEWKIYDIVVDDASLVSNYRYQFNSIITKDGYDHLIGLMQKKLDQIRNKRGPEGEIAKSQNS